jgi:hypothetical protein
MTRRALLSWPLLLLLALGGCRWAGHTEAHESSCTPPAGGRCAADVAWPGPIDLSPDGRRLHGNVLCGGSLHATESGSRVVIRLHVGAMGPGTMACARVDVGVRLSEPLGSRTVVDAVSGSRVQVVPVHHPRPPAPTLGS